MHYIQVAIIIEKRYCLVGDFNIVFFSLKCSHTTHNQYVCIQRTFLKWKSFLKPISKKYGVLNVCKRIISKNILPVL